MELTEQHLHAILERYGETRLRAVVRHFYTAVPADPILGPMYPPDDLDGAEQRLADFLVYRLGGPATYLETRGHPRLRMRHGPFRIDAAARIAWLDAMGAAVAHELEPAPEREHFMAFLTGVAEFLTNTGG